MLAVSDNTGEFPAGLLRRGNAGADTAADHISVLDAALAQIPDGHRQGPDILIRTDTAGGTMEFLAHIQGRQATGVNCLFSVGWAITDRERAAIATIPAMVWADAVDADGGQRDGAALAEISGVLPARVLADYPTGTRVIVRRERPHPEHSSTCSKNATGALHRLRLAKAEPKALRYRLLHVAAHLSHGQRRLRLRIQQTWP